MHDEELLNQVGMVQKKRVPPTETKVHDISVGVGEALQIRERTAPECDGFADTKARTWPGRVLWRTHACAPFQPFPKTNRRHTHNPSERSFSAALRCGAITRSWMVGSLLQ